MVSTIPTSLKLKPPTLCLLLEALECELPLNSCVAPNVELPKLYIVLYMLKLFAFAGSSNCSRRRWKLPVDCLCF